ncbi:MAG: chorismate-binding protein, partial [Agromyces sp.]
MTRLLAALLDATDPVPFAVVRREHEPTLDVLIGDVVDVERLADIPLDGAEVLALVPFRQVRERGFVAHDDGAPLRCLVVRDRESIDLDVAIGLLPEHPIAVDDLGVDVSDAEYADRVHRVIDEEIGRGEGAN